jgi:tetratricopeptide (TPR) repeat protein
MKEINTPKLILIEDHHQAYYAWKEHKLKNLPLVHIDAHIDFNWIDDESPSVIFNAGGIKEMYGVLKARGGWNLALAEKGVFVGIDNYIYPAIKEGIVKEFYWVVPDKMLKDRKQRKIIKKIFQHLKNKNPRNSGVVKEYVDRFETHLLNVKTTVMTLSSLPKLKEDVLLDIDTDFMLIDSLDGPIPYFSKKPVFPWILPEGVVDLLKEKGISSSLTTISYSVEGGFTPLRYKFLGDELKALLSGENQNNVYLVLHKALDSFNSGRCAEASGLLEQTLRDKGSDSAALYYLLYQIYRETDQAKALEYMKKAASFDCSYKTIYNNRGLLLQRLKKHKEAVKEYWMILDLYPEEIDYRLLMSDSLIALGRFDDALLEYQRVLKTRPDHAKALSLSGYIYLRKKDYVMAKEFLLKALETAEQDAFSNYWLGLVYEKLSRPRMAIRHVQRSVILGLKTEAVYLRLSLLHAQEGNFFRSAEKLFLAAKRFSSRKIF